MTAPRSSPPGDEPFFWWGPGWNPPPRRTLREVLQAETLDIGTAAHLWAALVRHRSLAVVAGASGAGKSTLLAALLEFLPADTARIYVRGCYETFAFRENPAIAPDQTALLVNELSPHLPVYLWGPGVATLLACGREGYQLLATAHAANAQEFVTMLAGSPLRLAPREIADFAFVLALDSTRTADDRPRASGFWRLTATRAGIALDPCAETSDISLEASKTAWFPAEELRARERALEQLRDGMSEALPMLPIVPERP